MNRRSEICSAWQRMTCVGPIALTRLGKPDSYFCFSALFARFCCLAIVSTIQAFMQRSHVLRMHRLRKAAVVVRSLVQNSGDRLGRCPNLIISRPLFTWSDMFRFHIRMSIIFLYHCLMSDSSQRNLPATLFPTLRLLAVSRQGVCRGDILHLADILLQYICARHALW